MCDTYTRALYIRATDLGLTWEKKIVERGRRAPPAMACPEYGHSIGLLFHSLECHLPCYIHTRLGWPGRIKTFHSQHQGHSDFVLLKRRTRVHHGCIIALVSACGCKAQKRERNNS